MGVVCCGWEVCTACKWLQPGEEEEEEGNREEKGREGNMEGRGRDREGREEGLFSPRDLAGHIPGKICAREDLPVGSPCRKHIKAGSQPTPR